MKQSLQDKRSLGNAFRLAVQKIQENRQQPLVCGSSFNWRFSSMWIAEVNNAKCV